MATTTENDGADVPSPVPTKVVRDWRWVGPWAVALGACVAVLFLAWYVKAVKDDASDERKRLMDRVTQFEDDYRARGITPPVNVVTPTTAPPANAGTTSRASVGGTTPGTTRPAPPPTTRPGTATTVAPGPGPPPTQTTTQPPPGSTTTTTQPPIVCIAGRCVGQRSGKGRQT